MTEAEWLASTDPYTLAKFGHGRGDLQCFRWLALEWGERIRHIFWDENRRHFDAYAAWVAGTGEHPEQVCPQTEFEPLVRWVGHVEYALNFTEHLRKNDPMRASVCAAESLAAYRPRTSDDPIDAAKTHRPRSAKKRAVLKAEEEVRERQQRQEDEANRDRIHREFCEQFRCVAGNPFRPVAFDPRWRTETAVALAAGIYELRAFDRLPILADALEDAGCDALDLLNHLRGPGPHARGCWAVDAVLDRV